MKLYKFTEPKRPGPNPTIGEMLEYSFEMIKVQHMRPGFLEAGTRVRLYDGSTGVVNHFVPYDGWNIGVKVDGLPHEGRITLRASLKLLPSPSRK